MASRRIRVAALLAVVALSTTPLFAVTKTWDRGGGTNSWGTANNWVPNGVPAAGDSVVLDHSVVGGAITGNVNVNTAALIGLTITAGGAAIIAFGLASYEARKVSFTVPNTDTILTLKFGSIFDEDAHWLIGVNELQRDNQDASAATIRMRIARGCGGAGRSPEPT